jgi:gliding motility-associated-like protein
MKLFSAILILLLYTVSTAFSQTIPGRPDQSVGMDSYAAFSNNENPDVKIPNAFSPDGDGINEYFRITGIEKYPEARLFVYTASNKKVFEKSHYGNIDFWGSEAEALWDGKSNLRNTNILPAGTYVYILDLDNGKQNMIKLGTIFIRR